jgi:hypothetical protein
LLSGKSGLRQTWEESVFLSLCSFVIECSESDLTLGDTGLFLDFSGSLCALNIAGRGSKSPEHLQQSRSAPKTEALPIPLGDGS